MIGSQTYPTTLNTTHIWMTSGGDQPCLFDDVVRFFGIFTVDGRCLDRNPLSLLFMFEQTP